jgi:hypothetical protein
MHNKMKTILMMLAVVTGLAGYSNAQEGADFRENLRIGLKAGLNLSNVYDTKGESFQADAKFGFAAGAFVSIPIGKFLGIQPEILFSQRGFKTSGSFLLNTYNYTRTTNYLDIPVLLQLKPNKFLTLLAGPQFSYLMKQTDNFEGTSNEQEFENDNLRRNTLCFTGGIDLNLNRIVFGARAGWDVQDNKGDGSSTIPRYKNVWYQATVGFTF